MKYVLLTSAHWWNDPRIFDKYARSLIDAGHEVVLVSPRAKGETRPAPSSHRGVKLAYVQTGGGRLSRASITACRVVLRALREKGDVYHAHDPELIPYLPALRLRAIAVFDAHEDLPKQVLAKKYLPMRLRPIVSTFASGLYAFAGRSTHLVAAASPSVASRFSSNNVVTTHNYPRISTVESSRNARQVVYVGALTEQRGLLTMIEAMRDPRLADARLELRGYAQDAAAVNALSSLPENVNYGGAIPPDEVGALLAESEVGLAVLHPTPAHLDGLPTKFYEYMMAGLPVVGSDFPKWTPFIDRARCGIAVSPTDPHAIADALSLLFSNSQMRSSMSDEGRQFAEINCSWDTEFSRFMQLVESLHSSRGA